MSESSKLYLVSGLGLLLALTALLHSLVQGAKWSPDAGLIGGNVHNIQETFDEGIAVDGTQVISGTGEIATNSLTVGSGNAVDKVLRATATVDPASIAANGSTSTVLTVTGSAVGDDCRVSMTTTTGSLVSSNGSVLLSCIAGTNQATVYYYNSSSTAAVDAVTTTFGVTVLSF